jgi:hypothetical protein
LKTNHLAALVLQKKASREIDRLRKFRNGVIATALGNTVT